MEAGKSEGKKHSPIVRAIAEAERGTSGEIHVHLSKKLIEKDPFAHASRLFHRFGLQRTTHRNAVLLYVNLRKQKFAIIGDEGIHKIVGQKYWEELAEALRSDLRSTHHENAVALAVSTIGYTLKKFFPLDVDEDNPNELPDEVTED